MQFRCSGGRGRDKYSHSRATWVCRAMNRAGWLVAWGGDACEPRGRRWIRPRAAAREDPSWPPGLLKPPYQVSLIMGVLGGIPPATENLMTQVQMLPPDTEWEVIGISHDQWRLLGAAISIGGNVRVGLEDNFYVARGEMAKSNGDLVAKAARMIRDQGREIATIEQSVERLGLVNT